MSTFPYTIRNYQPADFDEYVRLNIEAEELEPTGRCTSPQFLDENLRQPNYSPEQDMFVAGKDEKLIGFVNVTSEQHTRRAILDCLVQPEHRRRSLARKLLACALQRARELRAKLAHVNVREDDTVSNQVLSRLGFRIVRHFLDLRLNLAEIQLSGITLDSYSCNHLLTGEEDKLAKIQNRCFIGTWGYNPNTAEEIVHRLKLEKCSPEDVILICSEDKPIAYCWTIIYKPINAGNTEMKGRIYMLGTDPDFRGLKLGRAALLAGLHHLKTQGMQVAEITVDSENTVAFALYRSIGFKVWSSSLWYEKAID
ncbi:GNAT family N-acetyltransferase [Chloroflexota bacterium]